MNKKQISEVMKELAGRSHKAQIKKYGGKKAYREEMARRSKMRKKAKYITVN